MIGSAGVPLAAAASAANASRAARKRDCERTMADYAHATATAEQRTAYAECVRLTEPAPDAPPSALAPTIAFVVVAVLFAAAFRLS